MPTYKVHGLTLVSDLPLPDVQMIEDAVVHDPVRIKAGVVPGSFPDQELVRRYYRTAPQRVLLRVKGVGRLLIEHGSTIIYERSHDGDDALLAANILGSGLATIRHQRAGVVLHGASICQNGRVFLVCGQSGAGKSTVAAHILAGDGLTLGDDVTAVGDAPDFLVHPGPSSTKLADDALRRLPHHAAQTNVARCISGKRILSTKSIHAAEALPLAGIVTIERSDEPSPVSRRLDPSEALSALHRHTFRKRFITGDTFPVLRRKWEALAHRIPVWEIVRPGEGNTLEQVVSLTHRAMERMELEGLVEQQ
ncbi:hypothetical protein [Porphyrobacter sp. AAP60]|uniref:hypothetical protein n=1 Tax=Porphyrobacter sp. AAP60 TaxID=1523423 RepID=UPI0006B9B986|nr:hypothetical protein [Porphyrobacter sp. AAP60]KPF61827.1 hypothetical protein IP79_14540 [Porphyrobacter sp. AAP60]